MPSTPVTDFYLTPQKYRKDKLLFSSAATMQSITIDDIYGNHHSLYCVSSYHSLNKAPVNDFYDLLFVPLIGVRASL